MDTSRPGGARRLPPWARWGTVLAIALVTALAISGFLAISRANGARRAADAGTAHAAEGDRRIEVGPATLAALEREHRARTGVEPTPAELAALVRDLVDREVLYREARALDLGRDDPIVKRRLTQKMEALIDAAVPGEQPSANEIRAWFESHEDRYRRPSRVSLTHVFFRRERIDGDLNDVAAEALESLEKGADPASMGDPFLRGASLKARSRDELAAIFGGDFAAAVVVLPEKRWSGPIASSFGWHLVRIDERQGERLPEVDEVRDQIVAEITAERRARTRRETLDRLRGQYAVVTPMPMTEPDPASAEPTP